MLATRMARRHAMLARMAGLKTRMARLSLMAWLTRLSRIARLHAMLSRRHPLHLLSRRHAMMTRRHVMLA